MTFADELAKLQRLKEEGTLSEEEFQRSKATLLREQEVAQAWNAGVPAPPPPPNGDLIPPHRNVASETRTWAILLHVSQFFWLIPFGGVLMPLVIWLIKKEELPEIDAHFRAVVNWQLSALIYAIICAPFVIIIVGIFPLIAIGLLNLIFPVIGAVKASEGVIWRYPLSIRFFG